MDKIDWKKKLTSRKLWAAIASLVSMLILAFHGAQETATQIAAIVMAGGTVIAYIVGEGLIDAAAANQTVTHVIGDVYPELDEEDDEDQDPFEEEAE